MQTVKYTTWIICTRHANQNIPEAITAKILVWKEEGPESEKASLLLFWSFIFC